MRFSEFFCVFLITDLFLVFFLQADFYLEGIRNMIPGAFLDFAVFNNPSAEGRTLGGDAEKNVPGFRLDKALGAGISLRYKRRKNIKYFLHRISLSRLPLIYCPLHFLCVFRFLGFRADVAWPLIQQRSPLSSSSNTLLTSISTQGSKPILHLGVDMGA